VQVKPECGSRLEKFANEFDPAKQENSNSKEKNKTLKTALCAVGFDCINQLTEILAGFVKGGNFMGKMVQGMLGDKVDVEQLDVLILAYYQNMCSASSREEEL